MSILIKWKGLNRYGTTVEEWTGANAERSAEDWLNGRASKPSGLGSFIERYFIYEDGREIRDDTFYTIGGFLPVGS